MFKKLHLVCGNPYLFPCKFREKGVQEIFLNVSIQKCYNFINVLQKSLVCDLIKFDSSARRN